MQLLPEISTDRKARIAQILKERVVTFTMYARGLGSSTILSANPPIPTANADFDREKAAQWVASHNNPKLRVCAQQMIDNLKHVSFSVFYQELVACIQQVNATYHAQNIHDDELLIVVPFLDGNKSNPWVTSLALPLLDITPRFIISAHPLILNRYLQLYPNIKRIICFDDASYSGVDLSVFLRDIKSSARQIKPNTELDIVVPYTTTRAKLLLSKFGNVISRQVMPSLADVLRVDLETEATLRSNLCGQNEDQLDGLTLTYFDHKLADNLSIPQKCLRDGLCIDAKEKERGIPFIPKINPPYRNNLSNDFWQKNPDSRTQHSLAKILTEAQCEEKLQAKSRESNTKPTKSSH